MKYNKKLLVRSNILLGVGMLSIASSLISIYFSALFVLAVILIYISIKIRNKIGGKYEIGNPALTIIKIALFILSLIVFYSNDLGTVVS